MGLPLGPTLANIFMCYHESSWLADCPIHFKPVLYKRYLDDTFLLFNHESHVQLFLNYLNQKHPNIKFTSEQEVNRKLQFLDCLVTNNGSQFDCSVYRKQTFTGMGISFFSFCTFRFKLNSITTLVHRAYNICTNFKDLHVEFDYLKQFFSQNGFPTRLVETQIRRFLSRLYNPPAVQYSPHKEPFYFSLPYFGHQSEKLKIELFSLLSEFYPQCSFNIILTNTFKIGSFFIYKDRLPPRARHSVVYKYCCARCASMYVGSTSRTFSTRMAEHAGRSFRTGVPLSHPPHSSIRSHAESCDSPVLDDSFSILATSSNRTDLLILESLFIHSLKPQLNDTQSAFPLRLIGK